jgi:hypothetical protein
LRAKGGSLGWSDEALADDWVNGVLEEHGCFGLTTVAPVRDLLRTIDLPAATLMTASAGRRSFWANMVVITD